MEKVRGYKVTDSNMQCRGYQFEIGKKHSVKGELIMCSNGFHFCVIAANCFNYYPFEKTNRVFEIEASEEILSGDDKSCGRTVELLRELTWQEVLNVVNTGVDNTGLGNTGNWNTGDRNTGDRNTGDWNTGNWNTGNWNTGNWNTGNWNTGYSNTGNWNTGNWNTGYSNTGDRNTGVFCTGEKTMKFFDKDSNWTEGKWLESRAYYLMRNYVDTKLWVPAYQMTDEEKEAHPSHKTTEGYLKDIPFKEAFTNAWHNWSEDRRKEFTSLPNFDAKIFELITGVKA